jgi:hypothetical protein
VRQQRGRYFRVVPQQIAFGDAARAPERLAKVRQMHGFAGDRQRDVVGIARNGRKITRGCHRLAHRFDLDWPHRLY